MPVKGHVVVNELFCKGCELCVGACPQDTLRLSSERITSKGYHPAEMADQSCTGCNICAVVCPEAAITVYRQTLRARAAAEV